MILLTIGLLLQVAASSDATARLRRDADAAQARFERLRRANLPREFGGGYATPCDATIGRYCYWYDSTRRTAVPEPKQISKAREQLLAVLDSVAAVNPADGWVTGQRVRYLLEAGRTSAAVEAARACAAERWWCAALEGLASHVSERYLAADSAFARALEEMTEPRRCEWVDVRVVMTPRVQRDLSRATCEERWLHANALWQVAQPLWTIAGNDLRTEHFSRLTMAEILSRADNAHGLRWSSDSRELLVRYGWAEWYTRQEPSPYMAATPRVTGHDREPSYWFFPDVESVRGLKLVTAESWRLREPAAVTRYAPRHIERMTELPHQLIRLPRGDSMLLVAVHETADSVLARDSAVARVAALVRGQVVRGDVGESGAVASLMVPSDTVIVSVEVVGAKRKHAARARYVVAPLECGAWCVSDLILFRPPASGGAALDSALHHALPEPRHPNHAPLGVLWELHGVPSASPAWVSLTISPLRIGRLRRLATQLRLAPEAAPVRLRWQMVVDEPRKVESVSVRLPRSARGAYRVALTIQPADAPPVHAIREIVLVSP
jgi:hypothetical protein